MILIYIEGTLTNSMIVTPFIIGTPRNFEILWVNQYLRGVKNNDESELVDPLLLEGHTFNITYRYVRHLK